MKGISKEVIVLSMLCILLQACATKDQQPKYDTSLYQGRPIDSLTQEEPPKTEIEAIKRGDAALESKNIDLALYEYIRSLAFEPSEYKDQTLYTIGRIHLSRNNNELAEQALLMAIDDNPNYVLALQQLGALYTATGRVDEGETYFLRSVNADQVRMNNKATIEFNTISAEAIRDLKVDKESPAVAYLGLGVLSDVKNEYDIARSFYDKAYAIKPNSVKLLINQGYSFYMSGDYTKAEMFTQKALKQAPNNEKAQNNMALIYLAKGRENKALNMFTRHMESYEALNNVGYFLLLQGKPENAVPYFQQAIDKKASYYKLANDNLERALSEIRMKEIAVAQ